MSQSFTFQRLRNTDAMNILRRLQLPSDIPIVRLIWSWTLFVLSVFTLLLCVSYALLNNTYVAPRIVISFLLIVYLCGVGYFVHTHRYQAASWLMVVYYTLVAMTTIILWGINVPVGLLLLAFVIILGAIMLGSRVILPITTCIILFLFVIQGLVDSHVINHGADVAWGHSTYGDVIGYSLVFSVFAVISRIAKRQSESALAKALKAESELEIEKSLLAVRLEEQTQRLRESQLEEMKYVYRFAELGQVTGAILHELANNLNVLTLDMDDLEEARSSDAIQRAKESIDLIDAMVTKVRRQLLDTADGETFDVLIVLETVMKSVVYKARRHSIEIKLASKRTELPLIYGDSLRMSQVITVLVNNAIEAVASKPTGQPRRINLAVTQTKTHFEVSVTDNGKGISESQRLTLFSPSHSLKPRGHGIGLFIAKQIIETYFKGSLELKPTLHTTFQILIPIRPQPISQKGNRHADNASLTTAPPLPTHRYDSEAGSTSLE